MALFTIFTFCNKEWLSNLTKNHMSSVLLFVGVHGQAQGDIAVRRKHYRAIKIKQLLFSLSHIIKVSLAMYETNCLKL